MVEGSDADQSGVVRVSLQDTRAEEEMEVWLPDGGCWEIGVVRGVQTLVDQRLEGRGSRRALILPACTGESLVSYVRFCHTRS